jgi:hypothetical protein
MLNKKKLSVVMSLTILRLFFRVFYGRYDKKKIDSIVFMPL